MCVMPLVAALPGAGWPRIARFGDNLCGGQVKTVQLAVLR